MHRSAGLCVALCLAALAAPALASDRKDAAQVAPRPRPESAGPIERASAPAPASPVRSAAAGPARRYLSSLVLRGDEVLTLDVASPRVPADELDAMLVQPEVLEAANRHHLANLGSLDLPRACRIGPVYVDPGRFRVGVALNAEGRLALRLSDDAGHGTAIPMEVGERGPAISRIAMTMLPEEDLDRFTLEVRLGALRGTIGMDFAADRLVVGMNNTAHDLLSDPAHAKGEAALALRLASRANAMTGGGNALVLDTYALALFHNRRVADAIATQRRALDLLPVEKAAERPAMIARLRAFEMAREATQGG